MHKVQDTSLCLYYRLEVQAAESAGQEQAQELAPCLKDMATLHTIAQNSKVQFCDCVTG